MKKCISVCILFLTCATAYSQVTLSDLNVKESISGTEKIPVSGSGHPAITPDLILGFIVQDNINDGDQTAPSENAVFDALALKQTITPTSSTGTAVAFDTNRSYCTTASPCTGNITFTSSGAVVGQMATMIHNDSSEPTFGSEFIKLSGTYATGEDNYIMFFLRESGKVWVTISQAQ